MLKLTEKVSFVLKYKQNYEEISVKVLGNKTILKLFYLKN